VFSRAEHEVQGRRVVTRCLALELEEVFSGSYFLHAAGPHLNRTGLGCVNAPHFNRSRHQHLSNRPSVAVLQ
jgi:hypothetical protein